MIALFNPANLFEYKTTGKETRNGQVFYEDVYTVESSKNTKPIKRVPLTTLKLNYETELEELKNINAYVNSYKRVGKSGKVNISTKIIECGNDNPGSLGFIAAIPFKGLIFGISYDDTIQPLKIVVRKVDKFEYQGSTYTSVCYVVGRAASGYDNLTGRFTLDVMQSFKSDPSLEDYDSCGTASVTLAIANDQFNYDTTGFVYGIEPGKFAPLSFDSINEMCEVFAVEYKDNKNNRNNKGYNKSGNYDKQSSKPRDITEDFINNMKAEDAYKRSQDKKRRNNKRRG